jgi:hypothetical protein
MISITTHVFILLNIIVTRYPSIRLPLLWFTLILTLLFHANSSGEDISKSLRQLLSEHGTLAVHP